MAGEWLREVQPRLVISQAEGTKEQGREQFLTTPCLKTVT